MLEFIFPLLFALTVLFSVWLLHRIINAVPPEDRTYADNPPKMLKHLWPLITIATFYLGGYLSVEYREKTIRRLRKVELDYALSPQQWFASRVVYGILFFSICWLLTILLGSGGLTLPLCALGFGFFYLEIWLRDEIKAVEFRVLKGLPNFLDMLNLAIESGCNLTVSINIAVEKTPDSPLKRAFARLLREVRSGRTRIDSLRTLGERMDIPAVTSLTSALVQAEKTGASLGTVLRAQSTQRTNERFSRAEKLAMEAPVKLLGPLILCIFPCTFIVLGFPIGMKMMHAF